MSVEPSGAPAISTESAVKPAETQEQPKTEASSSGLLSVPSSGSTGASRSRPGSRGGSRHGSLISQDAFMDGHYDIRAIRWGSRLDPRVCVAYVTPNPVRPASGSLASTSENAIATVFPNLTPAPADATGPPVPAPSVEGGDRRTSNIPAGAKRVVVKFFGATQSEQSKLEKEAHFLQDQRNNLYVLNSIHLGAASVSDSASAVSVTTNASLYKGVVAYESKTTKDRAVEYEAFDFDLASFVSQGMVQKGDAYQIAVSLCRALLAAHARGWVLCDLQPRNVVWVKSTAPPSAASVATTDEKSAAASDPVPAPAASTGRSTSPGRGRPAHPAQTPTNSSSTSNQPTHQKRPTFLSFGGASGAGATHTRVASASMASFGSGVIGEEPTTAGGSVGHWRLFDPKTWAQRIDSAMSISTSIPSAAGATSNAAATSSAGDSTTVVLDGAIVGGALDQKSSSAAAGVVVNAKGEASNRGDFYQCCEYSAPECFSFAHTSSNETFLAKSTMDVWTFAMILFYVFTGHDYFPSTQVAQRELTAAKFRAKLDEIASQPIREILRGILRRKVWKRLTLDKVLKLLLATNADIVELGKFLPQKEAGFFGGIVRRLTTFGRKEGPAAHSPVRREGKRRGSGGAAGSGGPVAAGPASSTIVTPAGVTAAASLPSSVPSTSSGATSTPAAVAPPSETKNESKELRRVVMLGCGESGRSTMVKQLVKLYGRGFDADLSSYVSIIRRNVVGSLRMLCEQSSLLTAAELNKSLTPLKGTDVMRVRMRQRITDGLKATEGLQDFIPPLLELILEYAVVVEFKVDDKVKDSLKYVLDVSEDEEPSLGFGKHAALLWADLGIQNTYSNRERFHLPDVAGYFLDKVQQVFAADYKPSDDDVIRARTRTTGIMQLNFNNKKCNFRVADVGGMRNERKKWVHCFDTMDSVVFVVPLSCYNQTLYEDNITNRMDENLSLFTDMVNSKHLAHCSFVLLFNKLDQLTEMLPSKPVSIWDPTFEGDETNIDVTISWIRNKFLARVNDGRTIALVKVVNSVDKEDMKNSWAEIFDVIHNAPAQGSNKTFR